ncbi:NAD(P)/FAD-dependent oxidoreductase [Halomicronema sp. CCY15110]|uniref:FAD-dependent oxidoreductase n=1 Tax=Halomicronema sp. CCY15110 TaxID=2767773 RepID=UPI0019504132|nr:NAD(P)/FAD-dependent oxidoreductase [Halomicronema sp. CCY15110]
MLQTVQIAGGGIAGLSAAVAFAKYGWQVTVYEKSPGIRPQGAGIYLWENGLKVLEALGVYEATIQDSIPAWRHQKRDQDGTVFAEDFFSKDNRLYVPTRADLLHALHREACRLGVELEFGIEVMAADPDGTIHLADGSSRKGDLVIGADGINSKVRDSLGLLKSRKLAHQFGYRAMISRSPAELETDEGRGHCEHWHGARRILYAPCTKDLAYIQLTAVKEDERGQALPVDKDYWQETFPHLSWLIDRLPEAGRGDQFEIIKLTNWQRGRVVLIGDAVNAQPPFLGQGGGCSMMSALALATWIEEATAIDPGIALWERHERRLIEWTQDVAYYYGELAFYPPQLRTAIFRFIQRSDWLKRKTIWMTALHSPKGTAQTLNHQVLQPL